MPLLALVVLAALAGPELTLEGYAEWREAGALIVDGQRLRLAPDGRFKGDRSARDFDSIPLGYEVKATGRRAADGAVLASDVTARPNGTALFERQVLRLTDEAETKYVRAGRYFTSGRRARTVGTLSDAGSEALRARRIALRVAPPYLDQGRLRVYTVDNPDWNAFAMGNFAVYVYTGLLHDMDDDELAIVLGHELAHATHEHTRRRFTKAMWVQLVALGVTNASRDVDDRRRRLLVNLLTQFTALAMINGYGRDLEDQADRVGLRYAYEAGYDVSRAPDMWRRFARKYGEKGRLAAFFLANHSQASQRAVNLEREIALNYPRAGGRATGQR
jgi:Zn-dependent protease with chaperone function